MLGSVTGVIGTLQATEVLKEILGIGTGLAGRLLIYDALGCPLRDGQRRVGPRQSPHRAQPVDHGPVGACDGRDDPACAA